MSAVSILNRLLDEAHLLDWLSSKRDRRRAYGRISQLIRYVRGAGISNYVIQGMIIESLAIRIFVARVAAKGPWKTGNGICQLSACCT